MSLLYAIVTFFLFGSSTCLELVENCYGKTYKLPFAYRPPVFTGKLYFTPNKGGSLKLLMENGEARDPRVKVSIGKVTFTDVKEKYGGIFSIAYRDETPLDVITLKVLPCSELVEKYYGNNWFYDSPEERKLLDFTPDNDTDQLLVLWNRTNPQSNKGVRGRMSYSDTWQMACVTQSDNGHYYFRKQDGTVLKTVQLLVKGHEVQRSATVGDDLFISYLVCGGSWTLKFTSDTQIETITLMKAGKWSKDLRSRSNRASVFPNGIQFHSIDNSDFGTYKFIDSQGNVGMTVWVDHGFLPTYVYVCVIVGIILVLIVCCCCVKKCCCKKSSTKRDRSAPQTAAAPAVYYHDVNQPVVFYAAPTTDDSVQPVVSPAPATTSPGPSVVASGGQGVTPAPSVGSDVPEPRFELKGMSFPSAPPLGSDTSHLSDVYNSDKLNFL
ncbi:hypothetical protein D5F01_LYC15665 [Larimichthys crocea]|uniref:Uncharacterized protein n=1 Tax=Larimichthys crocea TaxID=215358 RepID=A0A6G0I3E4_LARCR|nr:hypothetical protein D5F01_LYC15665 [Larimichthys crocea]